MKVIHTGTALALAALAISILAGCTVTPPEMPGDENAVEIREYQGHDLSSVGDFRENSIRGPQYVDPAQYTLKVGGLVENEKTYTYDEVVSGHETNEKVTTLYCVEGWDVTLLWEGVYVKDLLDEAGVLPEAKVVIFKAVDGYSTSFFLDYIMDNNIMMAYKMNEITIPPERGFPFMLVAESKWGYKWVKWISEIELSDDVNYEGYWEQRGYSDVGDLDKSFFD